MNRRQFIQSTLGTVGAMWVAGCGSEERVLTQPTLTLGQIDLSFHAAAAAVVARILTDHGHPVEFNTALHEEMFARMQRKEVDLLSSAWLPGSHGAYLAPFENEVEKLSVLYNPYAFWGVPDYVPEDAVSAVADLLKPDVTERMTKVIQGIGPGAGISRFSVEIMQAYGLGSAGYEFRNGTQQDCEDAFTRAVEEKRWVVVPLWHPQHLHHRYRIRELAEPKGLLRGKDEATLILRKEQLSKIEPEALRMLRRMHLGNVEVTYLDYLINVEKKSPAEAAARWFQENPEVVERWRNG
uniref:Substrate-binding transporter protein n=1 Tax=Cystobacter fuscus TaxID=43 RepID=A0A3S7UY51_9BACT|nr:substrate-binding transporter protein [Cystobacter fuscus]